MSQFLQAVNLSKTVSRVAQGAGSSSELVILDNINLSFAEQSRNALVGPSGSGKTTLLGLLAGLDIPSRGQVLYQGEDITTMSEDQRALLRAGRVGFIFQSFQLLPQLTALENVMLPLEMMMSAVSHQQLKQQALDILTRVGLGQRVAHYPNQLSGGEQQRCAIARAYVVKPRLLFADEPTGNLDSHTGEQIIELLLELNQQEGTCLVMATHDARLAERCEHVIRLENGKIV